MPNHTKSAKVEISLADLNPSASANPEQIAKDITCLGGYAYQIIDQQSKRVAGLRSQVLQDTDIEPLHQMRVGTRRLRSALILFEDVMEIKSKSGKSRLPKLTKGIKKLTQALGNVRDLDVMQQWFETMLTEHSKSNVEEKRQKEGSQKEATQKQQKGNSTLYFSKAERKTIQALLKTMKKRRESNFGELKSLLKSDDYKMLLRQFKQWVKQPAFTAAAQQTAQKGAAQKIIAPIASLLEHPGWLVATRQQGKQTAPIAKITLAQIDRCLAQEGDRLHNLRKQIKQVRYQAEFFRGLYGIPYAAQIREFRDIQEILGELQDQSVIGQFLSDELGDKWNQQLPTLEATFRASRVNLWQQWQPYQRKYLKLVKLPPAAQSA
jgi:CHAD domain-containing protein